MTKDYVPMRQAGQPTEKYVQYGDIPVHIRVPVNPTGLVFLVPGAKVDVKGPLIEDLRAECEKQGRAVVVVDVSDVELFSGARFMGVHQPFQDALDQIIAAYIEDNEYVPETFEFIGHSVSGASVLSLTNKYPVSSVIALDPLAVGKDVLKEIGCPVHLVTSNVRSYRATGRNMFRTLEESADHHTFHVVETSDDKVEGHLFLGATREVASIVGNVMAKDNDLEADNDSVYKPDGLE